jgi:hypothetical protein
MPHRSPRTPLRDHHRLRRIRLRPSPGRSAYRPPLLPDTSPLPGADQARLPASATRSHAITGAGPAAARRTRTTADHQLNHDQPRPPPPTTTGRTQAVPVDSVTPRASLRLVPRFLLVVKEIRMTRARRDGGRADRRPPDRDRVHRLRDPRPTTSHPRHRSRHQSAGAGHLRPRAGIRPTGGHRERRLRRHADRGIRRPARHAGSTEPSPVLTAMGLDHDHALGSIRLSLGRWTIPDDVNAPPTCSPRQRIAGARMLWHTGQRPGPTGTPWSRWRPCV